MNKQEYLDKLGKELYFFEPNERQQIIDEFESYIIEKTNEIGDEAKAIAAIDEPAKIAAEYAEQENIKTSTYNKYYVNSKEKIDKITTESASKIKNQTEKFTEETKRKTKAGTRDMKKPSSEKIKASSNSLIDTIFANILKLGRLIKKLGLKLLVLLFMFFALCSGLILFTEVIGAIIFIILVQLNIGWLLLITALLFGLAIICLTVIALKFNLYVIKRLKAIE